jgi:hydroxyacylglutathione hydrolase
MDVVPLLVSKDNYAYLLIDKPTKKTAVVDPLGFLTKVKPEADKRGLEIVACLLVLSLCLVNGMLIYAIA